MEEQKEVKVVLSNYSNMNHLSPIEYFNNAYHLAIIDNAIYIGLYDLLARFGIKRRDAMRYLRKYEKHLGEHNILSALDHCLLIPITLHGKNDKYQRLTTEPYLSANGIFTIPLGNRYEDLEIKILVLNVLRSIESSLGVNYPSHHVSMKKITATTGITQKSIIEKMAKFYRRQKKGEISSTVNAFIEKNIIKLNYSDYTFTLDGALWLLNNNQSKINRSSDYYAILRLFGIDTHPLTIQNHAIVHLIDGRLWLSSIDLGRMSNQKHASILQYFSKTQQIFETNDELREFFQSNTLFHDLNTIDSNMVKIIYYTPKMLVMLSSGNGCITQQASEVIAISTYFAVQSLLGTEPSYDVWVSSRYLAPIIHGKNAIPSTIRSDIRKTIRHYGIPQKYLHLHTREDKYLARDGNIHPFTWIDKEFLYIFLARVKKYRLDYLPIYEVLQQVEVLENPATMQDKVSNWFRANPI